MTPSPDEDLIRPSDFRRADPAASKGPRRLPVSSLAIASALVVLVAVMAFTLFAHPTRILITPTPDRMDVVGGPSFALGDRFLLLGGNWRLRAELVGHHPLDEAFEVPGENGEISFTMRRLPGRMNLTLNPDVPAEIRVDGTTVGNYPIPELSVEPGDHTISVHPQRYLEASRRVRVEGMDQSFDLAFDLEPAWADVTVRSTPAGAELRIDDEPLGAQTPADAEIIAGERLLTLHLPGYKVARARLDLTPSQQLELEPFVLERIDGLLAVTSEPTGATVTVDGNFRGRTPLELDLAPERSYQIELFKAGHQPGTRRVRIEPGVETALAVNLEPVRGSLRVAVQPAGARVFVDGRDAGPADQVLELTATEHRIEITLDGHVPYRTTVIPRPEFPQEIALTLKTIEQARIEAIKPEIVAANGQAMKLIQPAGRFSMGASRREPGRRANEVLREVEVTRPYYVATTEVTNAQYRQFDAGYDSGSFEQFDLDGDALPVVNLSWAAVVRYCNWLSQQDELRPVYRLEGGEVRGFDPDANGYRLPTEAEWAYVARRQEDGSMLRFPWGPARQPPEDRLGNFSDRAAANLLARSIPDYTDGYVVTAPVGNYDANRFGLHDLGGNVAEWINDFYGATADALPSGVVDPLGPPGGEYHVIRGSSWMHGQLVDLRMSFRDYGRDGRPDVGFRLVRWLE